MRLKAFELHISDNRPTSDEAYSFLTTWWMQFQMLFPAEAVLAQHSR